LSPVSTEITNQTVLNIDASVRKTQRGGVIDAVTHMAHCMPGLLQRVNDALFLLRVDLGKMAVLSTRWRRASLDIRTILSPVRIALASSPNCPAT
jgi:hypothetical protein